MGTLQTFCEISERLRASHKNYRILVEDKSAGEYYGILANLREGLASEKDKAKAQTLTKILSLALDDHDYPIDASYQS